MSFTCTLRNMRTMFKALFFPPCFHRNDVILFFFSFQNKKRESRANSLVNFPLFKKLINVHGKKNVCSHTNNSDNKQDVQTVGTVEKFINAINVLRWYNIIRYAFVNCSADNWSERASVCVYFARMMGNSDESTEISQQQSTTTE